MKNKQAEKQKSVAREYIEAILIALVLALFIRTFIVQAFKIPSGSMLHTLLIGDHILVSKFIYGIKNPFNDSVLIPIKSPNKGDIVVFKYPEDPKLDYIKRVIATAGDTLEIRDKKVFINGAIVEDSHGEFTDNNILSASESPRDNFGPVTVPDEHIFVMGDNRDNSFDGRFWGFVDLKAIRGKAFIIYWSWDVKKDLLSWDRLSSVRWSRIGNILH
ncbi:signal peptidase I Serine peptidase, MEROPS family S26A [Candidatus Electrothrix aarhusensis]|jgi:signal peptidase I|uniref:Signal peptidase I n=1 Tax=Candidatus Electrothrix aarhusensis TaxID=1859131 RepID=A0A3S3QS16_9BACT|nr:signal peptidase I Serine peptidase, MEROPS family S26A [Candidatus Electrothrix aarhusensis]